MAFSSRITYVSTDAGQLIYTFGFTYIDTDYVKVYFDDVLQTGYTVTTGQVTLASGAAIGVEVLIRRETPTAPLVDFVSGVVLTEADLDLSFQQGLHVAVESKDDSVDGIQLNAAGDAYDANSKKIENIAAPTASGDAARKSETDALDTRVTAAESSITVLEGAAAGQALITNGSNVYDATSIKIINLLDGVDDQDAVTKTQLDNLAVSRGTVAVDYFTAHSKRIKNLAAPINDTDASTKKYVDDNITSGGDLVNDTSPQLGGMLDINGFDIGDGTLELLSFSETTSAVNELTITNAPTTVAPSLTATGDDTNIDLTLDGKGSGVVKTLSSNLDITGDIVVSGTVDGRDIATDGTKLDGIATGAIANVVEDTTPQLGGMLDVNGNSIGDGTLELVKFVETGSAVNEITIANAATAGTPDISATGDDTDIDLSLGAKGAGHIILETTHLLHTATENDDHALEIDCDAAGFGDIKALDIAYTTGAITTSQDEAIILVNIDESLATGGDIAALEVLSTEGGANKICGVFAGVGVSPIEQLSGVFVDPATIDDNGTDERTALISGGAGNVAVFTNDNEYLIIGSATKFEEAEFILDTGSSGNGIAPTIEHSLGVGTWATFSPVDGTDGMKHTGVMAWLDSDIPSWAPGAGSEYLIRITRTRNSLTTTPIMDQIGIASATEYSWSKDGDISVKDVVVSGTVDGRDVATDGIKLDGVEAAADVTDSTNVDAAGAVMESDFSPAFSIMVQQSGTGSPETLNVANDTLVGRTTGGGSTIDSLTATEVRTLLNVEDGSTADQSDAEIRAAVEAATDSNVFTDADHTNLNNQSGINTGDEPDASTTVKGIVELATEAEVNTGTDTTRAVTPASLATIQTDVDANTAKVTNATHTGDVTGSTALTIANSAVTTAKINDGAVTLAKNANIGDDTVMGNVSGGLAAPSALSVAQLQTLIGYDPNLQPKCFGSFDPTTSPTVESNAYNVSSITRNGVGDYTINFTTAMSSGAYTVSLTQGDSTKTPHLVGAGTATTTSFDLFIKNASGTLTDNPEKIFFTIHQNA